MSNIRYEQDDETSPVRVIIENRQVGSINPVAGGWQFSMGAGAGVYEVYPTLRACKFSLLSAEEQAYRLEKLETLHEKVRELYGEMKSAGIDLLDEMYD